MTRKLWPVIASTIFIVGVGSSFEPVRNFFYKAHDSVFREQSLHINDRTVFLADGWVIDRKSPKSTLVREKGLITNPSRLVSIHEKVEVAKPCGAVSKEVRINDFAIIKCRILGPDGELKFFVYDFVDQEFFLAYEDESAVADFVSGLHIVAR